MIRTGTEVKWKWGDGYASGTVEEVHHSKVTRTIKGSEVTRNGSDDDPAYVITVEGGGKALKSASELERKD